MNTTPPVTPEAAQAVVDFWFGTADEARSVWFRKSDAFDAEIAQHFGAQVEAALRDALNAWHATPQGCLATLLLLDQFTRNIFRGTPRAFAGDALALALARRVVAAGQDLALPPLRRWFVYLPFEHAEDLAQQDEGARLFKALAADAGAHSDTLADALDYAERHRAVIRRFGRFPHRNEILGRVSTHYEREFLEQPGSRF